MMAGQRAVLGTERPDLRLLQASVIWQMLDTHDVSRACDVGIFCPRQWSLWHGIGPVLPMHPSCLVTGLLASGLP